MGMITHKLVGHKNEASLLNTPTPPQFITIYQKRNKNNLLTRELFYACDVIDLNLHTNKSLHKIWGPLYKPCWWQAYCDLVPLSETLSTKYKLVVTYFHTRSRQYWYELKLRREYNE